MDDTAVTQEPKVEAEANQREKQTITQKSIDDIDVTQEPTVEMEQFHPREAVTPSIVSACGRTSGLDKGWCSERMLLIPELQKWNQRALSLQEEMISLKAHKRMMDSLMEKWLKEEWEREWEA